MAAFSSIALGASVALGIGSAVAQNNAEKKRRADVRRATQQQETEAREAASLLDIRETPDARVELGSQDDDDRRRRNRRRAAANAPGIANIGGLSASQGLGI